MSTIPSGRIEQAAAPALASTVAVPERLSYKLKRVLLGPPLVSSQMHEEKLSKRLALGVLSSDCISSSAYGTEEMLIILLGVFGLAGFHILAPMTAVILVILVLMTLSYREVVMAYTRAGGSYVVCRENFGYKMAQVAAVALLIDYVVTVAVQTAAAVAAITSALHQLSPYKVEICLVLILLLAYGNLRGIREAGKAFAFPTYFFFISATAVIVVGVAREIFGDLPQYELDRVVGGDHQMPIHDQGHAILSSLAIFYLLKAFANGGASLTGLEAISDGVSAFKAPNGPNARRTLVIMSSMLAFLVIGIGYLSMETRSAPFEGGTPDRHLAGGGGVLRARLHRPHRLHHRAGRDRADPDHRREHPVHRLPVPGQLRGRGLVPAPSADPTRAPAGVQQRHHHPDVPVDDPAGGRPGQGRCAGAVLLAGRVHRFHAGRLRDGEVPHHPQGTGLEVQVVDQRQRRCPVAGGRPHHRGGQVHRGCLGGAGGGAAAVDPADAA